MIITEKTAEQWTISDTLQGRTYFIYNYSFFNKYKDYGYANINAFVEEYFFNKIDKDLRGKLEIIKKKEDKEDGIRRRNESYIKKLKKEQIIRLKAELREEHPYMTDKEIEKMAYDIRDTKHKINWQYLNKMDEQEISVLKKRLKLKKRDIAKIIDAFELEENEFQTTRDFIIYARKINISNLFNAKNILNNYGECPFIKNNKCVITVRKQHFKILSFDPDEKAGIAFDLFDLLSLYGIGIMDLIRIKNIVITTYNEYLTEIEKVNEQLTNEKKRFKRILKEIKKLDKNNRAIYNYLKNHLTFLEIIIKEGEERICSTKYLQEDGKAIFFNSCRYLGKKYNTRYQKVSEEINLLCVLGILSKITDMTEDIVHNYEHDYNINYLVLNDLNWDIVEERIKVLKENKITPKNINFNSIKNVFGEDLVEQVFQKKKDKQAAEIKQEERKRGFIVRDEDVPF
ncbi:hypothetical protein HZF24_05050 [Sedimentibacter hydroxybenzoicus DSM 7310]|uniref:Uncharacterized protein n=1 Tax=Sedimentibacter hydroxybenzoicus DSM 7310 TaxID=1123245 RepID=A0A974BIQ3_SEDHY|nr:hypothetical protein [Sedimentibacter hydroxybenzoicus]NYB73502.1 hypothetical protein [Sedimentibacter hydroxybenzoicus DSM 7310]